MYQTPLEEVSGCLEGPIAKVSEKASGRDLYHRSASDDPREEPRIVGEPPIALGMRNDRRDLEQCELVEDCIGR